MSTSPNLTEVSNDDAPVVLHPNSGVFNDSSNKKSKFNARKAAVFVADLNAVALALLVATILNETFRPNDPVTQNTYFWFFLLSFPIWPIAFTRQFLYRSRHISRSADEAQRIVKAISYGFLAVFAVAIFSQLGLSRLLAVQAYVLMLIFVGIERSIARYLFKKARANGENLRNVLIIGKNAEGAFVRDMLDGDASLGYKVLGYLEDQLPRGLDDLSLIHI